MDLDHVLADLAPRLLRYATGRTGDPGLGEEIAQETLTALVQRWRRLGPPDSPEAFVFAIARRRAGRAVLKRRLLLPLSAVAHHADSTRNPEDLALANAEGEARTEIIAIMQPTEKGEQFMRRGGKMFNYAVSGLEGELPFDITWSPSDVYTAFHVLARMFDADVEVAPALSGRKLAVTIKAATMSQAFDAVCRVAGCRWQLVEKPKRLVRVTERGQEPAAPSASEPAPSVAEELRYVRVYGKDEAGVKPPVPITEVKPVYTPEARQAKIQGQVGLSCIVLPDGSVADVEVVGPLDPGLDEQAIKAARQWRFKPGTKDGRPVMVRIDLDFTFTLR